MIQAVVLGGSNNSFDVETEDGLVRLCSLKGKKLKDCEDCYNPLAPGDRVEIVPDELDPARGQIISLVKRNNRFERWNQKGKAPQLLAANLDLVVCVTTPAEPPFRPRFVDRALIQADAAGIPVLILLNKADLQVDADTEDRLADWERLGYEILRVSAVTGYGLDRLRERLAGRLSALVGQSGVGKSSLLNALSANLDLRTGAISEKFDRGTHTTTRGMLYHLPELTGGKSSCVQTVRTSIIDTPGVRRFVLHGIEPDQLALYFREMEGLVGSCSFGLSCSHRHEPGCKILEAVYSGVIHEQRYDSWLRIQDELAGGKWAD